MNWVAAGAIVAISLSPSDAVKVQFVSRDCPSHDSSSRSFASGTAHWDLVDFDIAVMSDVTVSLTRSGGRAYLSLTFSQIRPKDLVNASLFVGFGSSPPQTRLPSQINMISIFSDRNLPEKPELVTFISRIPIEAQYITKNTSIYLGIDCDQIRDPEHPSPPPSRGPVIRSKCGYDPQRQCWVGID